MSQRLLQAGLTTCLALLVTACTPVAKTPLDTISFTQHSPATTKTLLVFLPGRGDSARSFERNGFTQAVASKAPGIDMIGVEAHLGYYRDRTLLTRLKDDVINPAKRQGYDRIWLVGISLGGLGAIFYDTAYPGDITGICLLAPFLGERAILDEISSAGGLSVWQPGIVGDDDLDREIWRRLKGYTSAEMSAGRVFLGFGKNDRFAESNHFFGSLLPRGQVFTTDGGHDWPAWRTLWDLMLKKSPIMAAHY